MADLTLSDLIVKKQEPKKPDETAYPEVSGWDEFKKGFRETPADYQNLATWLDSRMPLGRIEVSLDKGIQYISPEEQYGPDFMKATPDARLNMMKFLKEDAIRQKFAQVEEKQKAEGEGLSASVGKFAGAVTSPTSLFPVGKGYKALSASAALLGGEYNALDQLANKGEIDPYEVAQTSLISAAAAPLMMFTGRKAADLVKRGYQAVVGKAEQAEAAALVNQFNHEMTVAMEKGIDAKPASEIAMKKLGVTQKEVGDAVAKGGVSIRTPSVMDQTVETAVADAAKKPNPAVSDNPFIDKYLGSLSTRIKDISDSVFGAVRKFEFDNHMNIHKNMVEVEPFLKGLNELPKDAQELVAKSLYNGEFETVQKILSSHSADTAKAFEKVPPVLKNLLGQLKDVGRKDIGELTNYYPRLVKNVDGLLSELGTTKKPLVLKALMDRATKDGVGSWRDLSQDVQTDVINKVISGAGGKGGGPGFLKERAIEKIDDSLMKYYASPAESLTYYVRRAVGDIEKRKFFGKSAILDEAGKVDVDKSIGSYISKGLTDGSIEPNKIDLLSDLLKARFNYGEAQPHKVIRDMRNIGYMTTIGNPLSALSQIQDMGTSAYAHGIKNTLAAIVRPNKITVQDLGIADTIAEEFSTTGSTAKALNKLFKISGFNKVDTLGKQVNINAGLRKLSSFAKKSPEKLAKKYEKAFGDQYPFLVDDLQNNRITDNVKLALWHELSDTQPIALAEMPEAYLRSPNGRLFYSLKTFAIKQLDMLRRDIPREWSKGSKTEAIKNAARYAMLVPTMGVAVDEARKFLLMQDVSVDDIPDQYIENLFKTFGASEYIRDKYIGEGKFSKALGELVAPPLGWVDAAGSDIMKIASGERDYPEEILNQLPLVGKFWYNFFGGGLEKADEKKMREMFGEDQ